MGGELLKCYINCMNYISHLKRVDKRLASILNGGENDLILHANIPWRLMQSIMSQQLSVKVARVFHQRFLDLCEGKAPTPEQVLAIRYEQLRQIGLSHAKATYVHEVARFCVENAITDIMLLSMTAEEIIGLLTQIKGVGKWTVEMLLMFSLGHADIFPVDDLGIQQAMIKLYKWQPLSKKELHQAMLKKAEKWRPFRTYACLHLWQWKDD